METILNNKAKTMAAGIALSILFLFVLQYTATLQKAHTQPKPFAGTKNMQFIYRGIPLNHHNYADALDGIARPMGGHSSPAQHRDGNTWSNYTSWTLDFMVAYQYATNSVYGKCEGVVLVKQVDIDRPMFVDMETVPGGNMYNESEILVKGMLNGCIPVKVSPGLTSKNILKLLKQ